MRAMQILELIGVNSAPRKAKLTENQKKEKVYRKKWAIFDEHRHCFFIAIVSKNTRAGFVPLIKYSWSQQAL